MKTGKDVPRSSLRARPALVPLLLGGCLGCAATMPLPPELQRDSVVVKNGSSGIRIAGRMKPIRIEPYRLVDLVTRSPGGEARSLLPGGGASLAGLLGGAWEKAQWRGAFSFRLEKKGYEGPLETAACEWRVETTSGDFPAPHGSSVSFRIPFPSFLACEFAAAPGAEPWRLELWTDFPSNPFAPKFKSGGALFHGDIRYEADSTNVIESAGIRAQYMTGTLFLRDGRAVAAVERIPMGRVLMQPSLAPEEQSLFVAVGAAIFVYDFFTAPSYNP